MDIDWLIAPHHGIGRLAFGLSPDAVAAMAPVYGTPSPLIADTGVAAEMEDLIVQLGDALSGEEMAALRGAAQDATGVATQNLTLGNTPILLEYRGGQLAGVTVEAGHGEANFEGRPVFALGAVEVLRLFERANGAPGRYRADEAAFDNIAVSLYRFSIASPHGEVRAIADADPDFRARSVTLRREPYRPADELDQFVTFAFDRT